MDHQEKVQMLNEVQEIRQLILELNQANAADKSSGSTTPGVNGLPQGGRGKQVLDLF